MPRQRGPSFRSPVAQVPDSVSLCIASTQVKTQLSLQTFRGTGLGELITGLPGYC